MNKYTILYLSIIAVFLVSCTNTSNNTNTAINNNIDSISVLNNLLSNDSLNPNLLANRAKLYYKNGMIDPALRDLQAALKISPNDPSLFLLLSDIYFVLGQTENSIASLKKAIRLNPKNEHAYLKLSETYILLNKANTAIKYADEAISLNRQNAESYYVKAMGLLENRDTSAAIINLGISANLDTNNYMTFMQLGAIYTAKDDPQSKKYFEKALSIIPNDERALYYLGMYYQEEGNFEKAIETFTTFANYYPTNKRVYYNLGYIYLVEYQDYNKAKNMFESAISISPGYVEAVYNLGRTNEAMGDYELARLQYKKALELLPNYPLAVQGMNRLDDILIRHKK